MLRIAIFTLVALCSLTASATSGDSLVRWSELKFSTPFEQQAFSKYLKQGDEDYLRMFLANAPSPDKDYELFRQRVTQIVGELKASPNLQKKNDKKIKHIYKVVHDRFFTQYEEENRFYEIIETGKYNCVTATALYAWFFDQLGIPYHIKEEPTHVYLVAYPFSDNIVVESTSPLKGFYAFTTEFKSRYVQTLKDQKIIGTEEYSIGVEALFNKYYFGTGNITFRQLIGIHYMNDALFRRDHDDIAGAYEQSKKAWLYYPGTRSEFMLMSFTSARIETPNIDLIEKSRLIGYASRMKNAGVTSDMILGEFNNITQNVLIKKNDRPLYKKCYNELIALITNKELAEEITFNYNYENGRIYYNTGNYVAAKPYLLSAFKLQPENADLGSIVVACIGQSFRNNQNNKAILDSLERYQKTFPALSSNSNFNSMLGLVYVTIFAEAYENEKIAEGEKYQKLFETLYRTDKNLSILSPEHVGQAYSNACAYYFKKGQKAKARQFIEQGLSIVPNDQQLKLRRQMISE